MTITQTLDKLEEHLAGIIPAFIMLGVVVFILLGLGAAVAPASAVALEDFVFETPSGYTVSNVESFSVKLGQRFGPFYFHGEIVLNLYDF